VIALITALSQTIIQIIFARNYIVVKFESFLIFSFLLDEIPFFERKSSKRTFKDRFTVAAALA
jgi:hypothetical protein